jgi:hypothetical protein
MTSLILPKQNAHHHIGHPCTTTYTKPFLSKSLETIVIIPEQGGGKYWYNINIINSNKINHQMSYLPPPNNNQISKKMKN